MDNEMEKAVDCFKTLAVMALLGLPKAMALCGVEDLEKAREYASSGDFEAARYRLELYKEVVNSEIDAVVTELEEFEKIQETLKGAQQ